MYIPNIFSDQTCCIMKNIYIYTHTHTHTKGVGVAQYSVVTTERATGVQSPAGQMIFSCSLLVQTSSEAHPASYAIGTKSPFSGVKAWPGRDADNYYPRLVPRS
jgi:hypothetical protein